MSRMLSVSTHKTHDRRKWGGERGDWCGGLVWGIGVGVRWGAEKLWM